MLHLAIHPGEVLCKKPRATVTLVMQTFEQNHKMLNHPNLKLTGNLHFTDIIANDSVCRTSDNPSEKYASAMPRYRNIEGVAPCGFPLLGTSLASCRS